MCLLSKSTLSWDLSQRLEKEGVINHSAHHAYYSILQLLKHIVLMANWAGEKDFDEQNGDSTHNKILNKVSSHSGVNQKKIRKLKEDFHRAKKVRVEADYGSEDISPDQKMRLNDSCSAIKKICDYEFTRYM